MSRSGAICMLAKSPVLGLPKTRLQPFLGAEGCLDLHLTLLGLSCQALQQQTIADVYISHTGEVAWQASFASCESFLSVTKSDHDSFWSRIGCSINASLLLQPAGDLGKKIEHVFQRLLPKYDWVLVIGSDCPAIDASYLNHAANQINSNKTEQVLLAPAEDGGYGLIGMNQLQDGIFNHIDWGSNQVFQQTVAKLQQPPVLLPRVRDCDDLQDLRYFSTLLKINKDDLHF